MLTDRKVLRFVDAPGELDGHRHDAFLLDTFVAAVADAEGGPARPWWEVSRERLARQRG